MLGKSLGFQNQDFATTQFPLFLSLSSCPFWFSAAEEEQGDSKTAQGLPDVSFAISYLFFLLVLCCPSLLECQ